MFRLRNIVVIVLLIAGIYAIAPPEKKRAWRERLRELLRALVVALVIYWIYMIAVYLIRRY